MSWILDQAFPIHTITACTVFDKYLYVGNEDFIIRVWNIEDRTINRKLQGHTGTITALVYVPKYDALFSCGLDGSICTWHGTSLIFRYLHYRSPHSRFPLPVQSLYYDEQSEILIAGFDKDITTFDISPSLSTQITPDSPMCPIILRQTHKIHNERIHKIIGCGRRIITLAYDRSMSLTQISDLSITKVIGFPGSSISSVIFDPKTQSIYCGDHSGFIRTYSADGLSLGPLVEQLDGAVVAMYLDKVTNLLFYILSSGKLQVLDPRYSGRIDQEMFHVFKNLPQAGCDKTIFESIMGNKLNTRLVAIVNHKYVFSWRWDDYSSSFTVPLGFPTHHTILLDYSHRESLYLAPSSTRNIVNSNPKKKKRSKFQSNETSNDPQVKTDNSPSKNSQIDTIIKKSQSKDIASSLVKIGSNIVVGADGITFLRPESQYVYSKETILKCNEISALDFSNNQALIVAGTTSGDVTVYSLAGFNFPQKENKNPILPTINSKNTISKSFGQLSSLNSKTNLIPNSTSAVSSMFTSVNQTTETQSYGSPIKWVFAIGNRLVSISSDLSIFLWDIEDKLAVLDRRERAHDKPITAAEYSAFRSIFATGDEQGFIRLWRILPAPENKLKEEVLLDHSSFGSVSFICYSLSCDMWLYVTEDNYVRGWKTSEPLAPPKIVFNVQSLTITAISAGYSNDVYIATIDKIIHHINLENRKEIASYHGHSDMITQIRISPTSDRWISVQWDGQIYVWSPPKKTFSTNYRTKIITPSSTIVETSHLPRLLPKVEKPTQPGPKNETHEEPDQLTWYEKSKKELMLKRREEEKQMRIKKKSPTYKHLVHLTHAVLTAIEEHDKAKEQETIKPEVERREKMKRDPLITNSSSSFH